MAPASVTDIDKDRTTERSSRSPPLRRATNRYLALINGVATLCTFNRKEVVDSSDSDREGEEEGGLGGIAFGGGGGNRRSAAASKSRGRGMDGDDRSLMSWRLGRSRKSFGQVCLLGMFNVL